MIGLWRSRFAAAAMLLFIAVAMGGFSIWTRGQSPIRQAAAGVLILADPEPASPLASFIQQDDWVYQISPRPAESFIPWNNLLRPIFTNFAQLQRSGMTLQCDSAGQPQGFRYQLQPNIPQAFLSRMISDQPMKLELSPATNSPLRALIDPLYLNPGDKILGELPARQIDDQTTLWPTVIIRTCVRSRFRAGSRLRLRRCRPQVMRRRRKRLSVPCTSHTRYQRIAEG